MISGIFAFNTAMLLRSKTQIILRQNIAAWPTARRRSFSSLSRFYESALYQVSGCWNSYTLPVHSFLFSAPHQEVPGWAFTMGRVVGGGGGGGKDSSAGGDFLCIWIIQQNIQIRKIDESLVPPWPLLIRDKCRESSLPPPPPTPPPLRGIEWS